MGVARTALFNWLFARGRGTLSGPDKSDSQPRTGIPPWDPDRIADGVTLSIMKNTSIIRQEQNVVSPAAHSVQNDCPAAPLKETPS